ncbi:MAG: PIN domain-containing protein [Myxococcales bacterium]|nr:PIN domain-containing protein [Myxococcales bacterium]
MIFVDTSVWVAFFRGREQAVVAYLGALIDGDEVALAAPVRIEILSGASPRAWAALRAALSGPALFHPSTATWARIETWVEEAAKSGDRFGVADLLIAAIAAEERAPVWSLDGDFARMARRGWIAVHRAPR